LERERIESIPDIAAKNVIADVASICCTGLCIVFVCPNYAKRKGFIVATENFDPPMKPRSMPPQPENMETTENSRPLDGELWDGVVVHSLLASLPESGAGILLLQFLFCSAWT